jgi:hypothetical protein
MAWLLVLDNVEDPLVLDKWWPKARKDGTVLITTRHRSVSSHTGVDIGIEVEAFSVEDGAKFLMHLLTKPVTLEADKANAKVLSKKLCGHALAINQMAALINARRCSISDFLILYEKYPKRIHRERKTGWRYIGYNHSLDTVWQMSFDILSEDAKSCLGIFAFVAADGLPSAFLECPRNVAVPGRLEFTRNDYRQVVGLPL